MILNTAAETMTPSEKTALQNQQLQTLVERAYKKTSFYQERMDSVGLTPADIQSVQDISKLPFMTAADLSANYPFGLLTIPISSVARFQQTADLGGAIGFTRASRNDCPQLSRLSHHHDFCAHDITGSF